MELLWVVLISGVIIAAAVGVGLKRNKRLIEEGKIIKRDISFIECAEIFVLKNADFEAVLSKLRESILDEKLSWSKREGGVVFKSGHGWTAQLTLNEQNADTYEYCFLFSAWQTRKGMPIGAETMNMLLTSVEKAFLSIDPDTQVNSVRQKLKTKTSFL